ncbi:beta-lactamase-like protein [Lipomyces kononenkoae]|uniref:Beta-lactamase-like protein n=1 Tax=Lipomyces kononenkoae TaxID=34357 RepID=A0ACC3T5U5_LIPKO
MPSITVTALLSTLTLTIGLQVVVGSQTTKESLCVATYVNTDQAVDMVSSLVIGSQAAMIIDLPMTIGKAKELATWVKTTTDKPLVAAFTSHNHPDHYLSGAAFFEEFPNIPFYANSRATKEIQEDAPKKVEEWSGVHGVDNIVQNTTLPSPYDYSFFALPGDEDSPVYLIGPVTGDTTHSTLFWIPSIGTVIAGDAIFGYNLHMYLSDLVTHALTESWLATLKFTAGLNPFTVIPGHASASENGSFNGVRDLDHSYEYVKFWQEDIESKGPDYFTPSEIFNKFTSRFPDLLINRSPTAFNRLNITAENFGRGGKRRPPLQPLWTFNNTAALNGWIL